jgi:hypothetical protein
MVGITAVFGIILVVMRGSDSNVVIKLVVQVGIITCWKSQAIVMLGNYFSFQHRSVSFTIGWLVTTRISYVYHMNNIITFTHDKPPT